MADTTTNAYMWLTGKEVHDLCVKKLELLSKLEEETHAKNIEEIMEAHMLRPQLLWWRKREPMTVAQAEEEYAYTDQYSYFGSDRDQVHDAYEARRAQCKALMTGISPDEWGEDIQISVAFVAWLRD